MKDTHWKVPLRNIPGCCDWGDKDDWKKQISYYSGSYGLWHCTSSFTFRNVGNRGELLGNRIVNLDSVTNVINQVAACMAKLNADDTNNEGLDTLYLLHWTAKILQYHGNGAFGWGGAAGTYSWWNHFVCSHDHGLAF